MSLPANIVAALTLWIHESSQEVLWQPLANELAINPGDYVYVEVEQEEEQQQQTDASVHLSESVIPCGLIFRCASPQPPPTSASTPSTATSQHFNTDPPSSSSGARSGASISVSPAVAQSFGWSNRSRAHAWKLDPLPREHQATYVELSIKDIHLDRADVFRLNQALYDQPVYLGQRIPLPGGPSAKCIVKEIWSHGRKRRSGVITVDTELVCRSQSARIFLCLQISSEMNHFGVDGSLYSERLVDQFLPALFHRWTANAATNHALSVVLFSRVIYEEHELAFLQPHHAESLTRDHQGRPCLDVYKVLVDMQAGCDWAKLQSALVDELRSFERRVLLDYSQGSDGGLSGTISQAHDGNVLEVINLACRSFDHPYIDCDLSRTGASIILVSPGTCRFNVDKDLLRLTTENLSDSGVGVEAVSLCKIPLHEVPVFAYRSADPTQQFKASRESFSSQQPQSVGRSKQPLRVEPPPTIRETSASVSHSVGSVATSTASSREGLPPALAAVMRPSRRSRNSAALQQSLASQDPLYFDAPATDKGAVKTKMCYFVPEWMDVSFYSPQPDKPFRADRYMPRMVMQEVESLGVESDAAVISLPLLPRSKAGSGQADAEERKKERDRLDAVACEARPHDRKRYRKRQQADERRRREEETTNQQKPSLIKRHSSSTGTAIVDRAQRGRSVSRAAPSTPTVQTMLAGQDLALTPFKDQERSPSVSSRRSRPDSTTSPTTSISTANGNFTPALLSRITAQAKATPAGPTGAAKTATAAGWLGGLLGSGLGAGKAVISKPEVSSAPPPSVKPAKSQAEQSLRNASPVRGDRRGSSSVATPIAIQQKTAKSRTAEHQSLMFGSSHPSSLDSIHSLMPRTNKAEGRKEEQVGSRKPFTYRVNPSNPLKSKTVPLHPTGRWGKSQDQRHIKWKAFCFPAHLPLYIDWVPTSADLAALYDYGGYSISVRSNTPSAFVYPKKSVDHQAAATLREMVCQRLAQGFQLLKLPKSASKPYDRTSAAVASPRNIAAMLSGHDFSSGKSIFMAHARHVHQLSYAAGQITVQVYMRQNFFRRSAVNTTFIHWPKLGSRFFKETCTLVCSGSDADTYDFPTLDRVIAGEDDGNPNPFRSSFRYWRTRFLVLPAPIRDRKAIMSNATDGLSAESPDEDIRLAGIIKLYAVFQGSQWNSPLNYCRSNITYCFVDSQLPSEYGIEELQTAQAEAEARARSSKPMQPLKVIPLGELAVAMRNPTFGLRMQTRRSHLRTFNYTFAGSELLDWLQSMFIDVRSDRQAAIADCRHLMEKGFFKPLNADKAFTDSTSSYYCLSPDFIPGKTKNWFQTNTTEKKSESSSLGNDTLSGPVTSTSSDGGSTEPAPPPGITTIKMSDAILSDLQTSHKSEAPCLSQIHLDIIHNPSSPLHFQVNWMGSSLSVDEMIRTLSRTVDRYGLRLVENSVQGTVEATKAAPLSQGTVVPFAINPDTMDTDSDKLVYALLRKFGYLLESVDAFCHKLLITYDPKQRGVTFQG